MEIPPKFTEEQIEYLREQIADNEQDWKKISAIVSSVAALISSLTAIISTLYLIFKEE